MNSIPPNVSAISQALGGVPIVEIKKTANNRVLVLLPSAKCVEELLPKLDEILNFPDADGMIVTDWRFSTRFWDVDMAALRPTIFCSGVVLEILVALGIIKANHFWPDVKHLEEALQNVLVCIEMTLFALLQ
ncbi:hypothetical protein ACFE04_011896 [Oxalis oulophora]